MGFIFEKNILKFPDLLPLLHILCPVWIAPNAALGLDDTCRCRVHTKYHTWEYLLPNAHKPRSIRVLQSFSPFIYKKNVIIIMGSQLYHFIILRLFLTPQHKIPKLSCTPIIVLLILNFRNFQISYVCIWQCLTEI